MSLYGMYILLLKKKKKNTIKKKHFTNQISAHMSKAIMYCNDHISLDMQCMHAWIGLWFWDRIAIHLFDFHLQLHLYYCVFFHEKYVPDPIQALDSLHLYLANSVTLIELRLHLQNSTNAIVPYSVTEYFPT